jgi:hypothetical protein
MAKNAPDHQLVMQPNAAYLHVPAVKTLSLGEIRTIREGVTAALEQTPQNVIFDLSGQELDPASLALLIGLDMFLSDRKKVLVLARLSPQAVRLLKETDLERKWKQFLSVEEALAFFGDELNDDIKVILERGTPP